VEEDPALPLSALQHQLFCPRQCALIHLERQWRENSFTVEGRLAHERSDQPADAPRKGVRTVTAMPLRSSRLGVSGVADVVELYPDGEGWRPFPVEHKRGRPKAHRADEVQLCAQAMCLEEMFGRGVECGALFYGKNRRRKAVTFDEELRTLTAETAQAAHAMLASGVTPRAIYDAGKCERCSLIDLCRPKSFDRPRRVASWLDRAIQR